MVALGLMVSGARAEVRLEVPDAVEGILKQHLTILEREHEQARTDPAERLALVRRARGEVESLLATQGYFTPRVTLEDDAEDWVLRVEPGERAIIESLQLTLRDGSPLTEGEWESLRQAAAVLY